MSKNLATRTLRLPRGDLVACLEFADWPHGIAVLVTVKNPDHTPLFRAKILSSALASPEHEGLKGLTEPEILEQGRYSSADFLSTIWTSLHSLASRYCCWPGRSLNPKAWKDSPVRHTPNISLHSDLHKLRLRRPVS